MKSEIIAWNRAQWRHQLLRNGCGIGSTYCRDAEIGEASGSHPPTGPPKYLADQLTQL